MATLIARFMGPTWDPPGTDRTQVGPCWPHESCYLGSHGFHLVPNFHMVCCDLTKMIGYQDSSPSNCHQMTYPILNPVPIQPRYQGSQGQHGAHMGLPAPCGPHVGTVNLVTWKGYSARLQYLWCYHIRDVMVLLCISGSKWTMLGLNGVTMTQVGPLLDLWALVSGLMTFGSVKILAATVLSKPVPEHPNQCQRTSKAAQHIT